MNKKEKYTLNDLNSALDMIEDGYSMSEAEKEFDINKSILAREMRKRKNEKGRKHIRDYNKENQL